MTQTHIHLVACSDPLSADQTVKVHELVSHLTQLGFHVTESPCLYQKDIFEEAPKHKAKALMQALSDPSFNHIVDVSGGDLSAMLLPHLNFDLWAQSTATFWGYSDLTPILNAQYTLTGDTAELFQMRNLVGPDGNEQTARFLRTMNHEDDGLDTHQVQWVRGTSMEGTLIGGNIRCFLKLSGTPWMPDFKDKLLFLEANSGNLLRVTSFMTQLQLQGAFDSIAGLILGQFTELDRSKDAAHLFDIVDACVPKDMPVLRIQDVGHSADSRLLTIGKHYNFNA